MRYFTYLRVFILACKKKNRKPTWFEKKYFLQFTVSFKQLYQHQLYQEEAAEVI